MATTDTSAAIKAIRELYCDAEATMYVLAALSNKHAELLKEQGHDPVDCKAVGLMCDAQDALGEFADWQRAVAKVAA